MASVYQINDEQAAVFLAALIIENGKHLNGKPLRVSADAVHEATMAVGIQARDFFRDNNHEIEFKLLK